MKLLSPTFSRLARMRSWRIEQWLSDPVTAQRDLLEDLISHGQYTEFGRKYRMDKISGIDEFRKCIPIQEYEDLKPYIERLMKGEENLLWDTPASWFAKSSGTTSERSKFIPITEESIQDCHYQAAKDVITMYYDAHPDSDLLTGKGLVIGGSHQINAINEEVHYGDLSAVLLQNMPAWAGRMRTPDLSIALMDKWEEKIEKLANNTIKEDVTSISGVPTWTLVLFKRILDITGKSVISDVWPNLELYMHGGVSFTPYKDQFKKIIGKDICYLDMYNASEGFFAAQSNSQEDGMLLYLQHGIYYEFLPVEDYGKPNAQTVTLRNVEKDRNYALVITTNGGLWRYLVGDTIKFVSLTPHKVIVTGRVRSFINAFGEEMIIDNADKAIAEASKQTMAIVNEYTAAPVYFSENSNGAHEWLIEFDKEPVNLDLFTEVLDNTLKKINSDYEAKREKDIALRMPIVRSMPQGIFQQWLKMKNKLGGQHKIPRLNNNRKILEEVLDLSQRKEPAY